MSTVAFRPPAPIPRNRPLSLLALLPVLKNNPLEAWADAHFEQFIVYSGLPFMPAVVVSDPDAIKHVLLDNACNYRKDDLLLRILSRALANGLLTVEGDQWRRQRHAVSPMFSARAVQNFAAGMADGADALVARWSELKDGAVVDVASELTYATLDVLQRTIFSGGIERDIDEFRAAMRTYFDTIGGIDPLDALGLPAFLPRPTRWPARRALHFFDSAVDEIIRKRRRLIELKSSDVPRDALTLLLEARDPQSGTQLSEEELRANIITLIAAGHETTANALTWSLYLLSQDADWKSCVIAEADAAMGHQADGEQLRFTRAVIEEALRLYPPIAAISRVAIEEDTLAGQNINRGTMVIVAPYLVHRHRRLWSRPDIFDPARFVGPARESIHRFAYLPFGAGPRTCLGAAFALQEALIVLTAIVRNFDLSVAPGFEVRPLLRITLRPKGGLPMVLRRRTK